MRQEHYAAVLAFRADWRAAAIDGDIADTG